MPIKPEFGNVHHIEMLKEGQLQAKLLAKDYAKAEDAIEVVKHKCDCNYCNEPQNSQHECPRCKCDEFTDLWDEIFLSPQAEMKKRIVRHFCADCEKEVIF